MAEHDPHNCAICADLQGKTRDRAIAAEKRVAELEAPLAETLAMLKPMQGTIARYKAGRLAALIKRIEAAL